MTIARESETRQMLERPSRRSRDKLMIARLSLRSPSTYSWLPVLVILGLMFGPNSSASDQNVQRSNWDLAPYVLYADDAYTAEYHAESSFPDENHIVDPGGYWPVSRSVPLTYWSPIQFQQRRNSDEDAFRAA